MTEEEKKYPKVEELLPEGEHILRVKPHPIFDDNRKPIENSQRIGESKYGNWYMYDTKIKDEWVSIFANDESKDFFDSGFVKANIVPKRLKGQDNDLFDKDGNKLLKAFYNELSAIELEQAKIKLKDDYVASKNEDEEEIDIEDLPL